MSALTAVVRIGTRPPLGGGIEPAYVAHLYGVEWPRFVLYEVRSTNERRGRFSTGCREPTRRRSKASARTR